MNPFDYICRVLGGEEKGTVEKDRILQEKEAELRRMQEMLAQMQAQIQQQQP
jgi:septin 2